MKEQGMKHRGMDNITRDNHVAVAYNDLDLVCVYNGGYYNECKSI